MLLMALGGGNFIGVVVGVSVGEDVNDAVGITDVANSPVGDVKSAALASGSKLLVRWRSLSGCAHSVICRNI